MRPLIGITAATFTNERGALYYRAYSKNVEAITRAGGLPVVVPSGLSEAMLREIYARLDGVLLPGGGDVDPTFYAAEMHPATTEIDVARDTLELSLARWAVADDVPVFGICRGHQVLNVALGGTLVQDIPTEVAHPLPHSLAPGQPRASHVHDVVVADDSRLAGILGTTQVAVNSIHHQSVAQAAPGARVTATAPDGVVEALEVPDKAFVLSVQWHPEDMASDEAPMQRLFDAFVQASAARMAQKVQPA